MRTSFTSQSLIHPGTLVHFDHEAGIRIGYDSYTMYSSRSNGRGLKEYYVPYASKWTWILYIFLLYYYVNIIKYYYKIMFNVYYVRCVSGMNDHVEDMIYIEFS